ncbi:tetraspanin-13 isoform X2 [Phlebotomus papatasi]|uniref:tetraspanin-13 isoform X2 n=1 Tax=Phlebotomus papatasi TaxID=29031 RepID=UPI002483CA38|nr:tetraspanin-13 isoform X2 [Phlebotomus papatasi]
MCGGFTCSKNSLIALNVLYIVVGFLLIGVGVYGRAASIVTNLPIVGGILACGIILLLISVLGLVGTVKHNQVMLFFYMIILFMLFLVQFSIACSCLAVNSNQQKQLAEQGWSRVPDSIKEEVQETFYCCGFNSTASADHPACDKITPICCSPESDASCACPPCLFKLEETINKAFKMCGELGLVFSFTEFLGVWLTVRYRNQKDPRGSPSAFL